MLRHHLLIAVRHLRRQKGYALLNIVGLAAGLVCCLLIGLYVLDELSYDRHHPDADRLYRLVQDDTDGTPLDFTGPGFALYMPDDFPEFEAFARVSQQPDVLMGVPEDPRRRFRDNTVLFGDSTLLDLFAFEFVEGSAPTAFGGDRPLVITQSAAQRYFGTADPVGQTLQLDNRDDLLFTVTAVIADAPSNTHLDYDFLTTYRALTEWLQVPYGINSFWYPTLSTYVRLAPGVDPVSLGERFQAFVQRRREPDVAARLTPALERVTAIHLVGAYSGGGTLQSVRLFGGIAVFILLLACVNFVNLATARSASRAREIGVRKSVGAARAQVARQFFAESFLTTALAMGLALTLAALTLPAFNTLAGKTLSFAQFGHPAVLGAIGVLVLITALVAGAYPSMVLARFQPVRALRDTVQAGGTRFRQALVVLQFTVTVVLLTATAVAYQQITYLRDARLGFDSEQLVALRADGLGGGTAGQEGAQPFDVLRASLEQQTEISQVAAASTRPGLGQSSGYNLEAEAPGFNPDAWLGTATEFVTDAFFETMGLEIVAGRTIGTAFPGDMGRIEQVPHEGFFTLRYLDRSFVVNETLARKMGWSDEEAIGQRVRLTVREGDVIYQDFGGTIAGVVQDYHAASLRTAIAPRIYQLAHAPGGGYIALGNVLVRLRPGNAHAALATISSAWQQVVPDQPFEAQFLDDQIATLYTSEVRMGQTVGVFSLLAVLIACLGLFGLAAFAAERRTKEIGVRKVLGASVSSLVTLLARDFVVLVVAASVLAAPLAYAFLRPWLEGFAYHTELNPLVFALAALAALAVALATVSMQALRAATANPVKALRAE